MYNFRNVHKQISGAAKFVNRLQNEEVLNSTFFVFLLPQNFRVNEPISLIIF